MRLTCSLTIQKLVSYWISGYYTIKRRVGINMSKSKNKASTEVTPNQKLVAYLFFGTGIPIGLVCLIYGIFEIRNSLLGGLGMIVFGILTLVLTSVMLALINESDKKKKPKTKKINKAAEKSLDALDNKTVAKSLEVSGGIFSSIFSLGALIVGLVVVLVIGGVLLNWGGSLWDKYVKKYDKPWWEGTQSQEVCATGQYEGSCYTLPVFSDGDQIYRVNFPNGGYLYGSSECYKAADIYDFDRFCRFWDQENRLWDINPLY